MNLLLSRFANDERGATAIEYAMIAGLISVLIVGGVTSIGTRIKTLFLEPIAGGLS
ncbi:MAG: Flp family type IVb pilin [Beijerinckiaceae bacterium]|jgi:pilus assembly protein Flp/PilA|nr:Flp family type IVb pilin [Beijerinckiaceae bacterium]MDO9442573.1 Flp family type IVb pilin [Beijerinckiaceae bacterium]